MGTELLLQHMSLLLTFIDFDFCTHFQEQTVYKGQGLPVHKFACLATSGSNTSVVENGILSAESQVI